MLWLILLGVLTAVLVGLYSYNTQAVRQWKFIHWFDGLAILRKFSFEDGQVSFANRFLESQAYQEAKVKGKISRSEFGTTARHSLMERLRDPLR